MPIITDTSSTPPVEAPVSVKTVAPEFQGVTVDTKYTPLTSLLSHIEGASWTVNYYSQVLGKDNALAGQSVDRSAVYQQYKLIEGLELKVTTALNTTQDTTTKEFTTSGQANIYPCGLIPNEGDHFIADVGDGREAVFEITSSEQRSIRKDAAYTIDYVLVSYSEQDNRIADLNSKVVEYLHYVADFLIHGQNPFITTDEKVQLDRLALAYSEVMSYYFTRFVSRDLRTLVLPGQELSMYDPFLTSTVLKMFRDENHPNIKFIRELNVGEDDNYALPNIWTALLYKRRLDLTDAMQRVGLVSSGSFTLDPMMDSLRYSGVRYAVYPADPNKSEDYLRADLTKSLTDVVIKVTKPEITSLYQTIKVSSITAVPDDIAPVILPSLQDTYVFSPAFYSNTRPGQSALELMFQNYLDEKAYDLAVLEQAASTYRTWGVLEQFYQLPFLMTLMRSAIRRM